MKSLTVFIPVFNEEKIIEKTIEELKSLKSDFENEGVALTILVVNDGSTDSTLDILNGIKDIEVVSLPYNRGLGIATKEAMLWAKKNNSDFAVKLDADLQHAPSDIIKVIQPLIDDKADICWGSRFKGSILYKMPLVRRWGNLFFTYLMNKVTKFKISDAQTGLMAFNKKYRPFSKLQPPSTATYRCLLQKHEVFRSPCCVSPPEKRRIICEL